MEELFQSLFSRFHIELETSIKSSDFIIDCVHLLYYKCHKIYFKRWESYLDSPDWIKNKKATRKPINKKKKKCFQCTAAVTLNMKKSKTIRKEHQKLSLL